MVTSIEEDIDPIFICNLLFATAYSEKLELIDIVLLEDLINNINYDYSSDVGKYICRLIRSKKFPDWNEDVINIVYDIAKNHKDPIYRDVNERIKCDTIHDLHNCAINCTRGVAMFTIMKLINRNPLYFEKYKELLELACNDKSPEVRCAVFICISNIKSNNVEWSEKLQLQLLGKDNRLLNFIYLNDILSLMNIDRELVLNSINNNYNSEDVELKNNAIKMVVALAVRNIEFTDVFNKYESMDEKELDTMLVSLLDYFDDDTYRDIVSENIIEISNYWSKGEGLTRLFYDDRINVERDKELLLVVMKTKLGTDSLSAFIYFLKKSTKPISDFSEIIFSVCRYNIDNAMDDTYSSRYSLLRGISKLILYLYDENSEGRTTKSKKICDQCLNLWDEMFEKQLGDVREISRKIMGL